MTSAQASPRPPTRRAQLHRAGAAGDGSGHQDGAQFSASLALALLLDFFTAAALLRLSAPPSWRALGAAALTIAIRQLASNALTADRAARHR
jgi:hypothetical protein